MKELKNKLLKAKKIKFLKNIFICVILLIVAAFIVNFAPGYKRDKYKDVINLVLNEENKTEELQNEIYVNENGTIYLSENDVKKFFDENLFYDEKNNQIITTSDTKVANIVVDEKRIMINGTEQNIIDSVIKINDKLYIPISDLTLVYNIDIKYIPSTKRVIIDNLNKGITRCIVSEETEIRYKPRRLSKIVGNLTIGEIVYSFYTTSKGWTQIRTSKGIVRICKSK